MKLITKIFIGIDILIIACFVMVYGPFNQVRDFWVTTAMATANHKYLAYTFYSVDKVDQIMKENYYVPLEEETNVNEVTIGMTETPSNFVSVYEQQILDRDPDDLYKLIEFKYNDFDCYLVAIYDPTRIQTAVTTKLNSGEVLTTIAKNNDAIVAINGGGYSWYNGYPNGLIVQNGELKYAEGSGSYITAAFNADGVLIAGNLSANDIKEKNITQALSFNSGPALIVNGNPITIRGTGGSGLNPRTVIAQRKDGIVLFLVVNGYGQKLSWKGRGGVYLNDLLVILQRYGAYNAVNMDGGSSTTMVINNELINSPCEPLSEGQDFIRTAWILK